MMILADENLNTLFIHDLRREGFDVLSIRETFSGIDDLKVAEIAGDQSSILVTEDKDFGQLMFAHKISKITIVFLRYQKSELETVRQQLLEVVRLYQHGKGHYFITIARGRVRITTL